jgi:endonuclease G
MKSFLIVLLCLVSLFSTAQLRDSVRVKNRVFDVVYSEKLEQPKWLMYRSVNRPTLVNRGTMDFYTEPTIKTSDAQDYYANEWDKGHLAPAATFSDSLNLLKQTFSYLNCMLQQQDLNRGEWRLLEEQERVWDNLEPLTIKIQLIFDATSKKLATGGTIPSYIYKHIYFEKQKKWKCFKFPNQKPTLRWNQYEVICSSH